MVNVRRSDDNTRMDAKRYRIFNADGEHVATVKPEAVQENIEFYNARREQDVDGNPIGAAHAEPFNGFVQGDS